MSLIANDLVKFEEYEIDRARWQLSWRDEPLPLNRKTFDLLLYLVDHADRVVSKEELLRTLWPQSFVEESNLTQHIFLLRKALSRHASEAKLIETVPGRGYRFRAVVREQQPATNRMVISASESITRITLEEEVDTAEPGSTGLEVVPAPLAALPAGLSRYGGHKRYWIAGGCLLAALLCLSGWFGWQRWLDRSGGAPVQVVLIPMEGTTGDAVLDKALTQAFRMDLAQSPFVSVVQESTVQATLAQMMHKPGDGLTPAMLREVCERTDSQSVLSGTLARVGQHFLMTEEASSCVNGTVVAAARYEAARPEDLPGGIGRLAATLRQKLGESRRSIARFDTPLLPASTTSLEALKNYTQAVILTNEGKRADAVALEKRALELDPNFAAARLNLALSYLSANDYGNGRDAIVKAYAVRDTASEPIRLAITAVYDTFCIQDLFAAEVNFRTWAELYPRAVQAWNGLSNVQWGLGHHADAAASGLRALALSPTKQGLYQNVAQEQIRSGDLQGARTTLDSAVAHKLDGDTIRADYLRLAVLLGDPELLHTQLAWTEAHPEAAYCRLGEAYLAIVDGRFADARSLLQQATALLRQQGLQGSADTIAKSVAAFLIEAGDRDAGTALFRSVPLDPEAGDDLVVLVELGDYKTADADLQAMRAKYPQGTVWRQYFGPRIEAGIALANHHPQQAIDLMEATRALDNRDPDTRKFRGDAYLAAGQPARAEQEYRAYLAHHELEPESPAYPLCWWGLGKALAAEGNRAAAVDAYQHFFALWAHADPDAIYLKQARQEFATLQ